MHVQPDAPLVQLPPGALDSGTVDGFTGTCVAVGGLPPTVFTVVTSAAEFTETYCGERRSELPLASRGIVSVSVATAPVSGVIVATLAAGVETGELPPPPWHATRATAPAKNTRPAKENRVMRPAYSAWRVRFL